MIFTIVTFFLASFLLMIGEGAIASNLGVQTIGFWESCLAVLAIFGAAIVFRTGFTVIDILRDLLLKSEEKENKK